MSSGNYPNGNHSNGSLSRGHLTNGSGRSLNHVEHLIQTLYGGSASPQAVDQIQRQLQEYQTGPSGWLLADTLSSSNDSNVKFFAALTYVVKINQQPLGDDFTPVLSKLLNWLQALVQRRGTQVVIRKVCSALVALFLQSGTQWRRPVRHVLCSLIVGDVLLESALDGVPATKSLLPSLNLHQCRALLAFATILAEDANNVPHNPQYSSCHECLAENIHDIVTILWYLFEKSSDPEQDLQNDTLNSLQAWISYAREHLSNGSEPRAEISDLLSPVMGYLYKEETFEATSDFLIDLFTSNDDSFVTHEHFETFTAILHSEWAMRHITAMTLDPDEDDLIFGRLALAFGQAMVERIVKDGSKSSWILDMVHHLTRSQNHKTIDQSMANAICDFWDNYTLAVPYEDSFEGPEGTSIIDYATMQWTQAIGELCEAAALARDDNGEFEKLSSEHPLSEFRGRVRSAVQASYDEFGIIVLQKLVDMVVDGYNAEDGNFGPLEVALFCLADMSTAMDYYPEDKNEENALLERLFASTLISDLTNPTSRIPMRMRKRAIGIIGDQESYFKSHAQQFMSALDMLFKALESPALGETAAVAIRNLADDGRHHLVPVIGPFIDAAERVLQSAQQKERSKESIITGVAYGAQAMPEFSSDQRSVIERLLAAILHRLFSLPVDVGEEQRRQISLTALAQLKALGKGLQAPRNAPIELSDDEEAKGLDGVDNNEKSKAVDDINGKILAALAVLMTPREDGSLLEAACGVLSIGYKEQPPGYFHFSSAVTADLITTTPHTNPRLDEAIKTAAAFLSSRNALADKQDEAKLRLIHYVCTVIAGLGSPSTDPELAHFCVDFISRLIPIHVRLLAIVPEQYIMVMFKFALHCLSGHDAMPKRVATNLWNALVGLAGKDNDDLLAHLLQNIGPHLVETLVFSFGGDAARSELDVLARTFRKLQLKQPPTKQWTEQALAAPGFPGQRASLEDKRKFLAQLTISRDDRTTERIVRDFWTLCRGTPVSYV